MIDTLCIGSGGFKGISFLAALNYLQKQEYINIPDINKYTCVSVGSIVGILLIVGYDISELCEIMRNLDYNIIKPDLNLDLMISDYGFDNGENIINFFKNMITKKINNGDITFLELYELTKKEIYIVATNFSKNTEKIFNYKDTPNVSVMLAVRMSISIPLIYTPVLFENDYYIDGALTNNVHILKDNDINKTLIICVGKYIPPVVSSIKNIIIGSIFIMCDQMTIKNIEKYNCLKIECTKNVLFSPETEMSKDVVDLLFLDGKNSAKKYLKDKLKSKIKELKKNIIQELMNDMINIIEINHNK